jgi:maltooligosyltrehalose synthase
LPEAAADRYLETFTGATLTPHAHPEGRQLRVADVLADFPVALLVAAPAEAPARPQENTV